jgi:ubiquinone/menaquinone biosynthesis C-methylase UbiE
MTDDDRYKDVHFAASLEITIERIEREGYILDIGGGGEGVIGQLESRRVVAIDKRKDELEEANIGDYLRIIMDATDLKFLDESFPTVTAFYSMMYMDTEVKKKVFDEIYRVLTPGGEVILWDLIVPEQFDDTKSVYAIMLKIQLPDRTIETGYGCPWANRTQNPSDFKNYAESAGFEIVEEKIDEHTIFLRLKKPE